MNDPASISPHREMISSIQRLIEQAGPAKIAMANGRIVEGVIEVKLAGRLVLARINTSGVETQAFLAPNHIVLIEPAKVTPATRSNVTSAFG